MNMKSHKLLLAALALGSALMTTGCRDDFSEMNQDPSAVTTGNISFLFAEAVNRFDPQPYLEYYYNAPMKYAWAGMGLSTSGASESILTLTIDGDQARQYINVLRVLRAMEAEYGEHYINLREYMATKALSDAEIEPTADDERAMQQGSTPPSLLSDPVHFNAEGYTLIGDLIFEKMLELGFFDDVVKAIEDTLTIV